MSHSPAAAEPRALFDGVSLDGWQFKDKSEPLDPSTAWRVEDGILMCQGEPRGYLATQEEYDNFVLEFEWRWEPGTEGGNSGLLIYAITDQPGFNQWPLCFEVQLRKEEAGDFWIIGNAMATRSWRPSFKPKGPPVFRLDRHEGLAENPLGEWNHMKVVSYGGQVTVLVNGTLANYAEGVQPSRGRIAFQSEGAPIHFRNIRLTPLE